MNTTDEQLKELRRLAEAALATCPYEKWWSDYYSDPHDIPDEDDAAFIAAASPTTVLALMDRVEKLETALRWMIDNDDTYEGDEPLDHLGGASWDEVNAYWIEGLNKARAALEDK